MEKTTLLFLCHVLVYFEESQAEYSSSCESLFHHIIDFTMIKYFQVFNLNLISPNHSFACLPSFVILILHP